MEVISFHVGTISRGKGRSSVQMAAYCSRSKLLDERTGETYSYAGRSDLVLCCRVMHQTNFTVRRFFGAMLKKSRRAAMRD